MDERIGFIQRIIVRCPEFVIGLQLAKRFSGSESSMKNR